MNRQLKEIGTVPETNSVNESLYPELKSSDKKVVQLEKNGFIWEHFYNKVNNKQLWKN